MVRIGYEAISKVDVQGEIIFWIVVGLAGISILTTCSILVFKKIRNKIILSSQRARINQNQQIRTIENGGL